MPRHRPGRARRGAFALACVLLMTDGRALARPYTVSDLLNEEALGPVGFDPTGRRLIYERHGPYRTLPGAGTQFAADLSGARLTLVDLARKAFIPVDHGRPGVSAGDFSPDGRRLLVYGLRHGRWRAGIASSRNGAVRWLDVTPGEPGDARLAAWRSPNELVTISRDREAEPPYFASPDRLATLTAAHWAAARRGRLVTTVSGSGAYRGLRARPPARDLRLIDVRTGANRALLTGELTDFELSPDGRRAAVLIAGADLEPQPDAPVNGPYGLDTQAHQLAIVDLANGRVTRPLGVRDVLGALLAWSGDGGRLLVYARATGAPWTNGELYRVDVAPGRATRLPLEGLQTDLQLRPEIVRAGWLGADPLVLARPLGGGRRDWYRIGPTGPVNLTAGLSDAAPPEACIAGDALVIVAENRLQRFDTQGVAAPLSPLDLRPLGLPRPRLARRLAWQPAACSVLAAAVPTGGIAVAGPRPGRLPAPAAGGRRITVAAVAPGGDAAAYQTEDDRGLQELWLSMAGAPLRRLTEANGQLRGVNAPVVRAFNHPGPQGQTLTSWLFLPPRRPGAPPPPLVVRPYLGDPGRAQPRDPVGAPGAAPSLRALVGHGYAVLVPTLLKADPREALAHLAANLLRIIDAAAADPTLAGSFDPVRLFIWSQSYGGYTTLGVIGQTDRFRAAAVTAGPSDLFSMYGTFNLTWRVTPADGAAPSWPEGWTETAQAGMGAPPWSVADRYLRNSPALHADRINTPLLLLHGDLDEIPLTQAEEMFSALYRQSKDAVLVTYWGESHALNHPATVADIYRRVFDWFDSHDPARRNPRPLKCS